MTAPAALAILAGMAISPPHRVDQHLNRLLTRLTMIPGGIYNATRYQMGHWRRWDAVDEQLIVGAYPRPADLAALHAGGVTDVINLCEELPPQVERLRAHGMRSHHLPLLDRRAPPVETVQAALEIIEAAASSGGRTYVHCRAGKGRGPTVALCHLMRRYDLSPEAAASQIIAIRPQVDRGLERRPVVQALRLR